MAEEYGMKTNSIFALRQVGFLTGLRSYLYYFHFYDVVIFL